MQFVGRDRNVLAPLSQLKRMPSIGRVKLLPTLLFMSNEYAILIVGIGTNGVTPERITLRYPKFFGRPKFCAIVLHTSN